MGRAAALAELDLDELVMIRANTGAPSHLPLDTPFVVSELLAARVELQAPLTRAQIRTLAEFATDPDEQAELAGLAADGEENVARYREEILFKRVSLLDMVQRYRSIDVPLNTCLDLLPGLAPRYYSISSSPTAYPDRCSITVGVLRAPARNGDGIYLRNVVELPGAHRAGRHGSRLHPATGPAVRRAGGSGDADDHDCHRNRLVAVPRFPAGAGGAGRDRRRSGPALLIYGCRLPDSDFIYEDEIRAVRGRRRGRRSSRPTPGVPDGPRARVRMRCAPTPIGFSS